MAGFEPDCGQILGMTAFFVIGIIKVENTAHDGRNERQRVLRRRLKCFAVLVALLDWDGNSACN
jgi:hypothetical protein